MRVSLRILAIPFLLACDATKTEEPRIEPITSLPEFGSTATRRFVDVATATDGLNEPRDLAFNPDNPSELWIVNKNTESTTIIYGAGTGAQRIVNKADSHRSHFMSVVSSIAMGAAGTFATCPENAQNFMGPALWPNRRFRSIPSGPVQTLRCSLSRASHAERNRAAQRPAVRE